MMDGRIPDIRLEPADVFATSGEGWLSSGIRFFTRTLGEPRTKASHVGIVVVGGSVADAVVVEALSSVKRHKLVSQYGDGRSEVAVYRPRNLSEAEKQVVVRAAERYVNREYGELKLVAHLADWALQGTYLFRRLAVMDEYPTCSWIVAHAFARVGKTFNVPLGGASPDDIFDFVEAHPDVYEQVLPLGPIGPKSPKRRASVT